MEKSGMLCIKWHDFTFHFFPSTSPFTKAHTQQYRRIYTQPNKIIFLSIREALGTAPTLLSSGTIPFQTFHRARLLTIYSLRLPKTTTI